MSLKLLRDAASLDLQVSEYLTTFFYADGTSETVVVQASDRTLAYEASLAARKMRGKAVRLADGPHEQLSLSV